MKENFMRTSELIRPILIVGKVSVTIVTASIAYSIFILNEMIKLHNEFGIMAMSFIVMFSILSWIWNVFW